VPLRDSPPETHTGWIRRARIVLKWPPGLARVSWRYLWRTTPMHRSDVEGGPEDLPEPLPPAAGGGIQTVHDGVGPLLHRRYSVVVDGAQVAPEEVVTGLAVDPNRAAPADAAVFVKTRGEPGGMTVGDEFVVRMPGPWDGPVRVVALTPTSFRLATLHGHLEAGQIEFRAESVGAELRFGIESWARPGDRLSHLLYNRLRLAKEIQLNLWTETCLAVAAKSGGRLHGGVRIQTRRVADPAAV
jgi:hypothetical protein